MVRFLKYFHDFKRESALSIISTLIGLVSVPTAIIVYFINDLKKSTMQNTENLIKINKEEIKINKELSDRIIKEYKENTEKILQSNKELNSEMIIASEARIESILLKHK